MTKTFIIAEAGVNYNADMGMAKDMIRIAKDCGVDSIKFQTGKPHLVTTPWASRAQYQEANTNSKGSQYDLIKNFDMPYENFAILKAECEGVGIEFMSSAFEMNAARYLNSIGMARFKIPSGEITNLPYLRLIGTFKKPVILSTGMSTMEEIADAIAIFENAGTPRSKISILHCTTEYPAPFAEIELNAIKAIKNKFHLETGFSDHTMGIEAPIAAVALGATIIEKHFTLDRNLPGPDQKASIEPDELRLMVSSIRNIELACAGSGEKVVKPSESKNISIARRSIVASRSIKKGERLDDANLVPKRPGNGLSPMLWDKIVGTLAVKDFEQDEFIVIS
jgi:N,N'-diacetyllegionaminate synthase